MKPLSDKQFLSLKSLEKRMRFVFRKFKIPGEFDDFFQNYCMEYRAGRRQHQTLDHYAIDYLRKHFGSNYKDKSKAGSKADSQLVLEYKEFQMDSREDDFTHSLIDIMREVNELKGRHRAIAGLLLIHGLNLVEIAFLMDLTESRTSQIVDDIAKKSRKSAKWTEERNRSLCDIEQAADLLGVPTLWLRQKLDELH